MACEKAIPSVYKFMEGMKKFGSHAHISWISCPTEAFEAYMDVIDAPTEKPAVGLC